VANSERAPEPTLEEIFASIRGGPAIRTQANWPSQQPAFPAEDVGKSLSETISSIEKAIKALATGKEPAADLLPAPAAPKRKAPARRRLSSAKPPQTAVAVDAPGVQIADPNVAELLRPLLRRWIDFNMSKAFEPSLRDEMRETGLPRWKLRRRLKRWRRQSRSAVDTSFLKEISSCKLP
jgi:hypothetical protein